MFFITACNNNTDLERKKCQASVQKEIENNTYFTELIAFEKYLIEHQLLIENEKEKYHNLVLKIIQESTHSSGILSSYKYDYQYSLNAKTDCQYNPVSYAALHKKHATAYYQSEGTFGEDNLNQFREFTESFYKKLDKNFIESKLFGYLTLHQLYNSSLKLKVKALNIINLNINLDNLFIEDQVTTRETLKDDLNLVIQRKKDLLKSLDVEDNLSLNMNVNPSVKMGRVMDIQAIIKSINYNQQLSNISIK
jgi:hypothetical protein